MAEDRLKHRYTKAIKECIVNLYNYEKLSGKNGRQISRRRIGGYIGGVMIGLLVLLPGIMSIWGKALLGLGILVLLYGIPIIILMFRKQYIYSQFYKAERPEEHLNLIKVKGREDLDTLYENSALTFVTEPDSELLVFVYNWLNNLRALKEPDLNIYLTCVSELEEIFGCIMGLDSAVMCISLKELNIIEENREKFGEEHFIVGSRYLDDIVDQCRKQQWENTDRYGYREERCTDNPS